MRTETGRRWQENIGRSIADVPDPWGEHDSYASHHIATFEGKASARLGIEPEFIRQHRMYRKGAYAEGIHKALAERRRPSVAFSTMRASKTGPARCWRTTGCRWPGSVTVAVKR